MKVAHIIAFILVIVGGLNWGLVAINPSWNLVNMLFGNWMIVERVVYALVGLSALFLIFTHKKGCKDCEVSSTPAAM